MAYHVMVLSTLIIIYQNIYKLIPVSVVLDKVINVISGISKMFYESTYDFNFFLYYKSVFLKHFNNKSKGRIT